MSKTIIAFVHIPKTAGTSFKFILQNSYGMGHCETDRFRYSESPALFTGRHLRKVQKFFPCLKSLAGHALIEPTRHLPDYVSFYTFLRDPVVRCASYYQDRVRRGGETRPFQEWIKDESQQNLHTQMIAGGPDLEKAKRLLRDRYFFVGLVEHYAESQWMFHHLAPWGLRPGYNHKNIFSDNQVKKELLSNPETLALLKKYNALDIKLYDFVEKEIFPRQREKLPKANNPFENQPRLVFPLRFWLTGYYNYFVLRYLAGK